MACALCDCITVVSCGRTTRAEYWWQTDSLEQCRHGLSTRCHHTEVGANCHSAIRHLPIDQVASMSFASSSSSSSPPQATCSNESVSGQTSANSSLRASRLAAMGSEHCHWGRLAHHKTMEQLLPIRSACTFVSIRRRRARALLS